MVLEPGDGKTLSRFDDRFRAQAKLWQLGAADAARAQTSINELLRLIEEGGHADSPITASVSYDDLDLTIKLSYKGTLPYVASEQRLPGGMVEEQIFAAGLSGFLSSVFPDRLNSQQKDGTARFRSTSRPSLKSGKVADTVLPRTVNRRPIRFPRLLGK